MNLIGMAVDICGILSVRTHAFLALILTGFWVISKMSRLTEKEMLKANTTMGIIVCTFGLFVCIIGSKFLPLI